MPERRIGPSWLTQILIRTLDLVIASLMLVSLAPVLLLTALAVRVKLGSPVLFRQRRGGRDNRPFQIIKFRSMRDAVDADGRVLPDHERLTPFGRFLRKSSLDELPEVLNVLMGQMSLVGPRPLFIEYWDYYTPTERRRLSVRPGITGLAQISGRNFVGWDRKLALDVSYVDRLSVGLYFRVLFMTAFKLFDWRQVSADPYAAEQPLNVERAAQSTGASNEQQ